MIMRVILRGGVVIDTEVEEFTIGQDVAGDIIKLTRTPTLGKTKLKYVRLDDVVAVLRVEEEEKS